MPGMYVDGEYDIAGCIVGLVDRARIVDGSRVGPGDALIGLASDGLHTNGYSLARRIFFDVAGWGVDRHVEELGSTLGDALLSPHRCYAPAVLPLLDAFDIKAMAHITGGGFYDNIPRSLPVDCSAVVDRRSWTVPPIFRLMQDLGAVGEMEMYRTFNMGIGLVLVVDRDQAMAIVEALNAVGETAAVVGEVVRGGHEVRMS